MLKQFKIYKQKIESQVDQLHLDTDRLQRMVETKLQERLSSPVKKESSSSLSVSSNDSSEQSLYSFFGKAPRKQ